MQRHFNAIFNQQASGFENSDFVEVNPNPWSGNTYFIYYYCEGGYVTNRTSMGTEICKSSIRYTLTSRKMDYVYTGCYLK